MGRNDDIKSTAKRLGISLWKVAEALGISDAWFSKLLRRELSKEKKQEIYTIIHRLKLEQESSLGA